MEKFLQDLAIFFQRLYNIVHGIPEMAEDIASVHFSGASSALYTGQRRPPESGRPVCRIYY